MRALARDALSGIQVRSCVLYQPCIARCYGIDHPEKNRLRRVVQYLTAIHHCTILSEILPRGVFPILQMVSKTVLRGLPNQDGHPSVATLCNGNGDSKIAIVSFRDTQPIVRTHITAFAICNMPAVGANRSLATRTRAGIEPVLGNDKQGVRVVHPLAGNT